MKLELVQTPELMNLNQAFSDAGFELRLVGGVVRDLIMGVEPKDIDLCTDATPQEMIQLATDKGFSVIETGLQHGTLTFVLNHIPFEITTLRIDTDTDGRHATVEFTRSFEKDAERRDLTINAMSMDFNGRVYDYFGGQADIHLKRVNFVGSADERIKEDYLRILRYFRFAARFGSQMDHKTLTAIEENAGKLGSISVERVWAEMGKLFVAPHAYDTLVVMHKVGVLQCIGLDRLFFEFNDADSAEAALASFFIGDTFRARLHCETWKMSNDEKKQTIWIAEHSNDYIKGATVQDWINDGIPKNWVISAILLKYGKFDGGLAGYAKRYKQQEFPVRGQDLLDQGYSQGKMMGTVLSTLKDIWKDSRYSLTKTQLLAQTQIKDN